MMDNAYFNQLPTKDKIIATRASLFTGYNLLGNFAIQFEIRQDNTVNDIEFKNNILYFSDKINNLSPDQLRHLLLGQMFKYVLNYQYVLENPSIVSDLNQFKMFLLSLICCSEWDVISNQEIVSIFDEDFLNYFSTNYHYKHGDSFCDYIRDYELPKISTFAHNECIKFTLMMHAVKGRYANVDHFFKRYYDIQPDLESTTDIIPSVPFIGKQMDKCLILTKMMNSVVKNDNNSYQFDRLYWLLTLPIDLAMFAITYIMYDKNILQKFKDNVNGFWLRFFYVTRYINWSNCYSGRL